MRRIEYHVFNSFVNELLFLLPNWHADRGLGEILKFELLSSVSNNRRNPHTTVCHATVGYQSTWLFTSCMSRVTYLPDGRQRLACLHQDILQTTCNNKLKYARDSLCLCLFHFGQFCFLPLPLSGPKHPAMLLCAGCFLRPMSKSATVLCADVLKTSHSRNLDIFALPRPALTMVGFRTHLVCV